VNNVSKQCIGVFCECPLTIIGTGTMSKNELYNRIRSQGQRNEGKNTLLVIFSFLNGKVSNIAKLIVYLTFDLGCTGYPAG
jgi:hypothetical protein